jgi:endonuclease YncB( thermonuclease family)
MKTFSFTPRLDSAVTWLIVLALLVIASCMPAFAQAIDQHDTCEVVVVRVVDGDTFYAAKDGDTVKVRVLGFDAFESRNGERLNDQAKRAGILPTRALEIGNNAKKAAKELLQGKLVVLHRGKKRAPNHDIYTRLLRYVIVDDEDFAELMTQRGFAAPNK